jgi:hypothetical protein
VIARLLFGGKIFYIDPKPASIQNSTKTDSYPKKGNQTECKELYQT